MGSIVALKKTQPTAKLPRLVEDFLQELRGLNRSPNTVRGYRTDLSAFLSFYKGSLENLSDDVLRAYFGREVESLSPATRARKRAALKSFLDWCYRRRMIDANPMERLDKIKLPEALPNHKPDDQIEKVLSVINSDRDRVLFTLVAETGIRIAEALTIKVEDLRLDSQELKVRGKGQKDRTVHLVKTESLRLLRSYLRKTGITEGLVFRPDAAKQRYGIAGKPLDYSVINRAWSRYCGEAEVKDCNIHALRHTYATRLINKGASIEMVSKLLGHASVQTTQRYARLMDETVKKRLEEIL